MRYKKESRIHDPHQHNLQLQWTGQVIKQTSATMLQKQVQIFCFESDTLAKSVYTEKLQSEVKPTNIS